MAKTMVQFKQGTKTAFDALTTKDPGTIYFVTDGDKRAIYKGDIPYTPSTDGLATEDYVDQKINEHIASVDAMRFMGTVASAAELDAKKATAKNGDTYKATAAFTITGTTDQVEIGDMIIANVSKAGFQEWFVVQSNIDGAVTAKFVAGNTGKIAVVGTGNTLTAGAKSIDDIKTDYEAADEAVKTAAATDAQTKADAAKTGAVSEAKTYTDTKVTETLSTVDDKITASETKVLGKVDTKIEAAKLQWETLS